MSNLSHPEAVVNRLPACIGHYATWCAQDCPQAVAWECLEASRLAQAREDARLARRRAGELGPVGRHLARLGYGPITCRDADTWRN